MNKDKYLFRQDRLEYFGHEISGEGLSPSAQNVSAVQDLEQNSVCGGRQLAKTSLKKCKTASFFRNLDQRKDAKH